MNADELSRVAEAAGITYHDLRGRSVFFVGLEEDGQFAVAVPAEATYINIDLLRQSGLVVTTYSARGGMSEPEVEAQTFRVTSTMMGRVPFRIIGRFLAIFIQSTEELDWVARLLREEGLGKLMLFASTPDGDTVMSGTVDTVLAILEKSFADDSQETGITAEGIQSLKSLLDQDLDVLDLLKHL